MFSEIREALRSFKEGFGTDPITLDLKATDVGFNTVTADWYARNGYSQIYSLVGGSRPAWSGEQVTLDSALNLSVVRACVGVISESLASLPLHLYLEINGEKHIDRNKPLDSLLHDAPNSDMSAMSFRETVTAHTLLTGNGFARVIRTAKDQSCIALHLIRPSDVQTDRDKQNRLVYVVNGDRTYTVEPNRPHDILHIPGLGWSGTGGYSVLALARQSFGTALSAEKYAARFYAAGGRPSYHIEWDKRFKTEEDYNRWRADWTAQYGTSDTFHVAPLLEPNMKWVSDGVSPEDMQFLGTRQYHVAEICRWFRVSPHLAGDLSRATFSNIEHLSLEFVTYTLMAWITRWEQAIWRCVLTPQEQRAGYYVRHNVSGLLRGDFASRTQGYASALQNGWMNIDEVRSLEELNRLQNGSGQAHHIQLNMQTVPGTGADIQQPQEVT